MASFGPKSNTSLQETKYLERATVRFDDPVTVAEANKLALKALKSRFWILESTEWKFQRPLLVTSMTFLRLK